MNKINIHRVLITPLDWGLGHATRCIPIIQSFQELQIEVILAAEGSVASLLHSEFPHLKIIPLKGYRVKYARTSTGLFWKLLAQVPSIIRTIREEHLWLEKIIHEEKIDLVISDNRYGMYTKSVPSIFMTHQLTIKAPFPFVEQILQKINYHYINRFSSCWVPDAEGKLNLAGILSHPKKLPNIPTHHIGILTRLKPITPKDKNYHYCFLISGPEPQRTIFENHIVHLLPNLTGNHVIVRGLPGMNENLSVDSNTKVFNHLSTQELESILSASEYIICRSGYTTLMELISLGKKAVLVPTPGQTEQLYLAKKLQREQRFFIASQKESSIRNAIKNSTTTTIQVHDFPVFSTKTLEALLLEI